jgi:hypothetical protein
MPRLRVESESLKGSLDGEAFDLVDELVAAIVASSRVAFRVLVHQAGAHALHHSLVPVVFRGRQVDHLDLVFLHGEQHLS